jgi:hypothetical protein
MLALFVVMAMGEAEVGGSLHKAEVVQWQSLYTQQAENHDGLVVDLGEAEVADSGAGHATAARAYNSGRASYASGGKGKGKRKRKSFSSGKVQKMIDDSGKNSDDQNLAVQMSKAFAGRINRLKEKLVTAEAGTEKEMVLKIKIQQLEVAQAHACTKVVEEHGPKKPDGTPVSKKPQADLAVIKKKYGSAGREVRITRRLLQDSRVVSLNEGRPRLGEAAYNSGKKAGYSSGKSYTSGAAAPKKGGVHAYISNEKKRCEKFIAEMKTRKLQNDALLAKKEQKAVEKAQASFTSGSSHIVKVPAGYK